MVVPNQPNWTAAESVLVNGSRKAIEDFADHHPKERCSFFALSVDYSFGDVIVCLDTPDNCLLHAKRQEARSVKKRTDSFSAPDAWTTARDVLLHFKVCTHNPHTADFKYPNVASLKCADWEQYFDSGELPDHPDPVGHVIVLLHNVVNKLVLSSSFDTLALASPFRIGIELPREDFGLVVMRVLNWPRHEGPRV